MFEWGSKQDTGSADNSKVLEPPETPAPLFAFRAFKEAMFGTPEPNADYRGRTPHRQEHQTGNSKEPVAEKDEGDFLAAKKSSGDTTEQVNVSPTKGILATPGTTTNKRKTVSFGDGVVDNEHKRDEELAKLLKTPPSSSDSFDSQLTSSSSDGKDKPRSRLTQALLDAREKATQPTHSSQENRECATETKRSNSAPQRVSDTDEDTVNLNEPRSQSGKYWKTEFESYRVNTNREIKKLIQYRSAAKSYAKKKDEEASRLLTKIQEEESKVTEMERRVSQLASAMVTEESKPDREKLVQDLAKQTALALQYKHKANLLRKTLEQHGVLSKEDDTVDLRIEEQGPSEKREDFRKTQQILSRTGVKVGEIKRQQSDLERLQDLVQSSEKKASTLEKENTALKQTISRYKQEMTKYEGRRKEREVKLKQREAKLETRFLDCRERLKMTSHHHRESEEALRKAFNEERRILQEQVDLLRLRMSAIVEQFPDIASHNLFLGSPHKGYAGIGTHDFGFDDQLGENSNEDDDYEPPSPSPRSKERSSRLSRIHTGGDFDMERIAGENAAEHEDEDTGLMTYSEASPVKTAVHNPRSHGTVSRNPNSILPSSPPDLPPIEPSARTYTTKQKRRSDSRRSYLPSHPTMVPDSPAAGGTTNTQPRSRRPHPRNSHAAKSTLDTVPDFSVPDFRTGTTSTRQAHFTVPKRGKKSAKLENMPPERFEVALANLRQKIEAKRAKEMQQAG